MMLRLTEARFRDPWVEATAGFRLLGEVDA